jgi:hypothetical protein
MATPTVPLGEFGTTGLRRWAGFIREEFLAQLQGARGMRVYREMRDNSAIVGACLAAIEMLIRQVSWSVAPFSEESADRDRAEFLETCLSDMSFTWADTISEHLTMLPYGFAFHELVYKIRGGDVNDPARRSRYSDGRVGWRKIPLRGQDTLDPVLPWVLDANGGIQGMRQLAPPDYRTREIPIDKALLFRARTEKNNPEGRSVLRNAYFSWYFSKKIAEIEGIGIARDLTGIPIGWIPLECFGADATANAKATKTMMESIVTTVARDEQEGLVLPLDYVAGTSNKRFDLTLLSSGGKRQFDTNTITERYERRIAMTMLADFVLMGHEQVGSFALSSDKTALFAVALGGWLDSITETYNTHAIPRLVRLNGWPTDRCPRLQHGDIEAPNLAALGDYISKCYGAGFQWDWDAGVDAHLRRVAGLPKPGKRPPAAPVEEPAEPPEPTEPGEAPPAEE